MQGKNCKVCPGGKLMKSNKIGAEIHAAKGLTFISERPEQLVSA